MKRNKDKGVIGVSECFGGICLDKFGRTVPAQQSKELYYYWKDFDRVN